VNTVMNLPFLKALGNPWVAERLAASQERLSSMELVNLLSFMFIYDGYKPIITKPMSLRISDCTESENQQLFCLQSTVRMLLFPVKYSSSTRTVNVIKAKVVPLLN
jgi:hypothetical protein